MLIPCFFKLVLQPRSTCLDCLQQSAPRRHHLTNGRIIPIKTSDVGSTIHTYVADNTDSVDLQNTRLSPLRRVVAVREHDSMFYGGKDGRIHLVATMVCRRFNTGPLMSLSAAGCEVAPHGRVADSQARLAALLPSHEQTLSPVANQPSREPLCDSCMSHVPAPVITDAEPCCTRHISVPLYRRSCRCPTFMMHP